MNEWIDFLGRMGFPFDFTTTVEVPRSLRTPLAQWWAAHSPGAEDVAEYEMMIDNEVVWAE